MLSVFTKWSKQQQRPLKKVLSDIYGIGDAKSKALLEKFSLQNHYRLGRSSTELQKSLSQYIGNEELDTYVLMDTNLKEAVKSNIQTLQDIRSYRGVRHLLHLPVRGQRTKTNARTQKNFKPKAQLLRTSYRFKRSVTKSGNLQKKMSAEVSSYSKTNKKKSRGRKSLQS